MTQALFENKLVRVKRCRYGPLAYLVSDRYIGQSLDRYGEYSEGEAALLRQVVRPGQLVVEAGANMGVHTVSLAKMVTASGTVLAFEPQRLLFEILCANLVLNGLDHVCPYPAALGDASSVVEFAHLNYGVPANFGGFTLAGATVVNSPGGVRPGSPRADVATGYPSWPWSVAAGLERVPVVRIDDLALPSCHLIKADVEGMEREVLAGAEETIRRHRPALYVENDRLERSPALIEFLFSLGYRLYWHLPPLFNPANFFQVQENVFGRTVSVNLLGLPAGSPQHVTGMREVLSPEDDWRKPR